MQSLAPSSLKAPMAGCTLHSSVAKPRAFTCLPRRKISSIKRGSNTQCRASLSESQGPLQYFSKAMLLSAGGLAGPALQALAEGEPEAVSQVGNAVEAVAAPVSDAVSKAAEAAPAGNGAVLFGFNQTELLLLSLPLVLYGIFSAYRQYVNPKAQLMNFLFIVWSLVLFGNIFSMVVFKVRFL